MVYRCKICGYAYDESVESTKFEDLPADWTCPVCGATKDLFDADAGQVVETKSVSANSPARTSSEVLVETLCNWGVKWVFGMVGHSNLGAADAVRKACENGKMKFVGVRHEGAAAFACSAYGKLAGKPAACLTIAGPGATNLITGLYDAKVDGAPVIALTGQIPSSELGYYAFQEIDLAKPFSDAVGSQYTLGATSRTGDIVSSACRNAILSGSPSQIILPDDMQVWKQPTDVLAGSPDGLISICAPSPSFDEINSAAKLVRESKKPFIIVGVGCSRAIDEVVNFAETFDIPFATTYRAKGFIPDTHPLACGVIGRSGTQVSAKIASDSDLIIGFGTSFSKHSEVPKSVKTIQIDNRRERLGRLRKIDAGLLGDIAQTLPILSAALNNNVSFLSRRPEIATEWKSWRAEKTRRAASSSVGAIDPAAVCDALSKYIPHNAIVSIDVGNVAYHFGRYFEAKNQRMLLSFYLGSIGVGLPSAMGAFCAASEPDSELFKRPVVAVVGDGGLGQYLSEWTTVVKNGMPIKLVVFNNSELAKISLEQRNARFDVWQTSLLNPSFARFSELCGGVGLQVSDHAKLSDIKAVLESDSPAIIEILTKP